MFPRESAAASRRRGRRTRPRFLVGPSRAGASVRLADIPRLAAWARRAVFRSCSCYPSTGRPAWTRARTRRSSRSRWTPVSGLEENEDFQAAGGRVLVPPCRVELEAASACSFVAWRRVRCRKAKRPLQLAFNRFLRDEWSPRTPRPHQLAGVHVGPPRPGWRTTLCFQFCTTIFNKGWLDWPSGCAIARPGASARPRRATPETLLRAKHWLQWQLGSAVAAAPREVNAGWVSLMGDLPFMVAWTRPTLVQPRLFRSDQQVGTPPDESSGTARIAGCRHTIGRPGGEDFAWIKAPPMPTGRA